MLVGWCPRAVRPGQLTYPQPKTKSPIWHRFNRKPESDFGKLFFTAIHLPTSPFIGQQVTPVRPKDQLQVLRVVLIDATASSLAWCARHRERGSGAGTTINLSIRHDKFVDTAR